MNELLRKANEVTVSEANAGQQPAISTMALPKNLTNELEAVYNAGVNIKSEIQKVFNLMPTTNKELREQIAEVTNYVMRHDRWIYARIDALGAVVAEYNTRISSISNRATDIHNYAIANRSRISSIDNQLQDVKGSISSVNDYAVTNRSRISSLDVQLQNEKAYSEANRSRITALDRRLTPVEEFSETNRGRITTLDGRLTANEAYSETNRGRITTLDGRLTANEAYSQTNRGRITTLDGRLTANEAYSETNRGRITTLDLTTIGLTASAVSQANDISTLYSMVQNPDLSLFSNLFGVNTISSAQSSSDGVFTKLIKHLNTETKGQLVLLRDALNAVKTSVDKVNTNLVDEIKAQLVMVRNNITALNANMLLNTAAVNSSSNKNAENLTLINASLKSLKNYDDTSFKKTVSDSIKTVTDAVKGIKDYTLLLTGLNANQLLNTVSINDFASQNELDMALLTAMVKTAAEENAYDDTKFLNLVANNFLRYYGVSADYENGIDAADGIFTKLVKGQFTRLMKDNLLNLEVFNKSLTDTLRAEFALLNDWFALVVEWLDMIYTKPSAVFEGTIFDYGRLQEMFDGISFGNVVNEAGTNLWDVLQELISALGGVVESIINIVPDLIDQLIALIIPENPNFFSDDINALIDSFDSKFEWTGTLTNTFSSVFSQPKSIKSLTVAIAGKQYKVVPDFVDLGLIKTILTGYFCFITVLTTYRRIVGSGDVIQ